MLVTICDFKMGEYESAAPSFMGKQKQKLGLEISWISKVPQNTNHEEINLEAKKGSFDIDKKVTNFLNRCLSWTEASKMSEHFLSMFFFMFSFKKKKLAKNMKGLLKKRKRERERKGILIFACFSPKQQPVQMVCYFFVFLEEIFPCF